MNYLKKLTYSFLIAPKFLPQASRAWANNSASDGDQSLVTFILDANSPDEDGFGTLQPSSWWQGWCEATNSD